MKNKMFASAVLLFAVLSSCVNRIAEDETPAREFIFQASLASETVPFYAHTRGTDAVNSLMVFDCMDGKPLQTLSQSSATDGFGAITMSLAYGKHELLFVGHKTEEPSFSYPSVTFNEAHDTFSCRMLLTVDEDTDASQQVRLSRCVAVVKVVATDAIPEGVSALRMKLSACYNTLDIATGYAAGQSEETVRTFTYSTSHIGKPGTTYSIYTFVPNREFNTDVTVEVLDAGGSVISTASVKGASVERNRQTVLTGELFGMKTDVVVDINDSWGDDINYLI